MDTISQWFTDNGSAMIAVAGTLVGIGLVYYLIRPRGPAPPPSLEPGIIKKGSTFLTTAVVVTIIGFAVYFIYVYAMGDAHSSGNLATKPVTSTNPLSINYSQSPTNGQKYGLMFWMYIDDWNTRFGETKEVIVRRSGSYVSPKISLHPTENTLQVTVSHYPPGTSSSSSTSDPGPANGSGGANDDSFTLTVPDIPIQTWVQVAVSQSDRILDVYINGRLVKSSYLPGVPRKVEGTLEIQPNGGFAGKVIDLTTTSRSLKPADALAHYNAGTGGVKYTTDALPSGKYKVQIGIFDTSGNEVNNFVLG